jgi:hypothetical protein
VAEYLVMDSVATPRWMMSVEVPRQDDFRRFAGVAGDLLDRGADLFERGLHCRPLGELVVTERRDVNREDKKLDFVRPYFHCLYIRIVTADLPVRSQFMVHSE